MALAPSITTPSANAMLDAGIGTLADNGKLRLYAGTIPTNADTALAGNTLLCELTMAADSFPAASAATLTANAITADASADATGTAAFFRLYKADGTTNLLQGSVGTATADMIINSTAIQAGAQVSVTSFVVTMPVV